MKAIIYIGLAFCMLVVIAGVIDFTCLILWQYKIYRLKKNEDYNTLAKFIGL